tara:strand:- start:401 stop:1060 length:660 start_codon:yes stop_codon:yes gene_type:complete
MPIFCGGKGQAPDWCELHQFDIVTIEAGSDPYDFHRVGNKEKLIIGNGSCTLQGLGGEEVIETGANIDLPMGPNDAHFRIASVIENVTAIRMAGDWGEEVGGSGLFSVLALDEQQDVDRVDRGDAVDYEKKTNFDCHFHDCDEYWILFEGVGVVYSEGVRYEVSSGDCVATGMGHHHDFPLVHESVRAVYFETTMERDKRRGHLWDHTHGKAEPHLGRI